MPQTTIAANKRYMLHCLRSITECFYNTPSPPAYAEYGDDANTGTLPSWAAVRRAMGEPSHPHASQSGNYRLCLPFDYQPYGKCRIKKARYPNSGPIRVTHSARRPNSDLRS